MTETPDPATGASAVTRVERKGIAMLRFPAALLRQGEAAVSPALAGFRQRDTGRPGFEGMPWRPSHLETVGYAGTGDWTLYLDPLELRARPGARPEIELWIDDRYVEEGALEIDYSDNGQISVGFRMDGEPLNVDVSEDLEDRVVVDIWTSG